MGAIEVQHPAPARHPVAPAARMAARAFADAARRPRQLESFMTAALRYGLMFGEVTLAPDDAGSAIWLIPGATDMRPMGLLRSGMATLPLRIGLGAMRRFATFVQYSEHAHKQVMHEPHWYLLNLAVDPSRQRQGVGSALLAPVLARADATGYPVYLETLSADNLLFYHKHNFEVAFEGQIPEGGPRFWGMARRPR